MHGDGNRHGMAQATMAIYAVDVGSIAQGNFAWARVARPTDASAGRSGSDIGDLIDSVSTDLQEGRQVALGFECPLFIPVRDAPACLTAKRLGEGNRPWSAGAGTGALATGLAQSVYILRMLRKAAEEVGFHITPTLTAAEFLAGEASLLLWEAFVSGKSKTQSHLSDAKAAARACLHRLSTGGAQTDVGGDDTVLSLIGAAVVRSGLSQSVALLSQPCLVVKLDEAQRMPG